MVHSRTCTIDIKKEPFLISMTCNRYTLSRSVQCIIYYIIFYSIMVSYSVMSYLIRMKIFIRNKLKYN